MTNAPESRKTHVTRIVGTNKAGDVLQDIWADVERIDFAKSATQTAEGFWQGLQRKFRWMDDPDNGDEYEEEGPPSRKTEIVKVCDVEAEDNPDDPEEWIPIRAIKSLRARGGSTGDQNYVDRLIIDESTDARQVTVRRIVHYDTNIDDDAQAAFDADPNRKAYVVQGENYQRDDSTKDEDQYVEHEIIEYLKERTNERREDGDVDRGVQTKLLNQYLIDEAEDATGEIVGSSGINPPYRLDPYQNIVNVNFSFSVIVAFVSGGVGLSFNIIKDRAKQLDQYDLGAPEIVGQNQVTLFKVKSNAKEFLTITAPPASDSFYTQVGSPLWVLVFAMDGSIDDSVARAKPGIKQAVLGIVLADSTQDPPGLIWSAGTNHLLAGMSLDWKIIYAKHRDDDNPDNKMVQCYPLFVSWTSSPFPVTYSGYFLRVYRLDKKGTGTSYGSTDPYKPSGASVDPAWHRQISTDGNNDSINYGVPFGDPPPLIHADIVNANDLLQD